METVRHYVVIDDGSDCEIPDDPRILDYDRLLADAEPFTGTFVVEDENSAAAMCYTSGTTGNPKGVVYSHRSTVLHSLISLTADTLALSERDVVLPIVPMFHANAWGLPYACLMAGSDIIFPGPNMTPKAILQLLADHKVTATGAVPTIWMGALPILGDYDLSNLRIILCGGSAVPKSLSEAIREKIGLPLTQGWGMTETSPLCTVGTLRTQHDSLSDDEKANVRARQGQAAPLVDLRLVDPDSGDVVPWDDTTSGEVQAAGPWIASEYYRGEGGGTQFTPDGWLRTGDVGIYDRYGYLRLVDRTKDLVKSGGEWISSVELENEIMAHPKVAEAAVIAIPHERWVERPMACVVVKPGESLTAEEVIEHLKPRVAKWWLPEAVEFIDEVPKTSVGKFSKKTLRDKFSGYKFDNSER
jgi:fatty-acyl-CoA synthase